MPVDIWYIFYSLVRNYMFHTHFMIKLSLEFFCHKKYENQCCKVFYEGSRP